MDTLPSVDTVAWPPVGLEDTLWKAIPGFEGYEAHPMGHIRSYHKPGPGLLQSETPRLLKGTITPRGYVVVLLRGPSRCLVHRLIASTFLENPERKVTVNHLSGVTTDNRVTNLEWATFAENNLHCCRVLRKRSGVRASKTKLSEDDVDDIRILRSYGAYLKDLSSLFGINISSVHKITTGENWATHK